MKDQLSKGWTIAPVREVIEDCQPGFASGEKNVDGGVVHLRMNNIGLCGQLVLDLLRTVPDCLAKPHYDLRPGDVLVCTTNSGKLVGKCAYFDLPGRYAFSNHLTRLRPRLEMVEGKCLRWNLWLHWRRGLFEDKCKHWVNQSTLPKDALLETEVTLPPLPEQRRIVTKLEALLAKVGACEQRLAKIPLLLKRFRQSVLAAACSGRLTQDWREENDAEPGTSSFTEAPEGFPLLPETWGWQPLELICERIVDCPHSTPKWTASGRLCARTTNLKPGILDLSEVRYVSDATFNERIERLRPSSYDILYSREGGILGIACMIPPQIELCLGQRMMIFRAKPGFAPAFLMHWLNSPVILRRVQELTGGSASPHLNVRDIKAFPTPVPPPAEQQEIVRRVEALFALGDRIEARLGKARVQVDKMTPSLLAKAFRGELVPQDPNDEPADKLLERTRSTREKSKR